MIKSIGWDVRVFKRLECADKLRVTILPNAIVNQARTPPACKT